MVLYKDVAGQQVQHEIPLLNNKPEGIFYEKLSSFLDAVRNGGAAPVPTSQILYNQAIIDGVMKSAEAGREIEIEIPEI